MNQSRTEMEDEIEPISVGLSDAMIAKQLAAESIQSTFRWLQSDLDCYLFLLLNVNIIYTCLGDIGSVSLKF